jgi:uroporphyrinogen decarboxylase
MKDELPSRERVRLAINHQEPDSVPINIGFHWQPYLELRKFVGLNPIKPDPDIWGRVWEDPELIKLLGTDCINIGLKIPISGWDFRWNLQSHIDHFSVSWKKIGNPSGAYYEMVDHPIKRPHVAEFENVSWLDSNNPKIFEGIQNKTKHVYKNTDLAIIMLLTTHIWERAIYMCGYENWWIYLVDYPEFCVKLLNKIADIQRRIYIHGLDLIGEYISILRLGGEDFGTQRGLIISPDMFREIVKPVLTSVFTPVKEKLLEKNPNGKIMLHSDGAISDLIPDFIDMGIDILDPVQPRAAGMNPLNLKHNFGKSISFHGGIDTQKILPFGSEKEVELEVRRKIEMLAPGGGYLLSPSHNVQPDVPIKNIIVMIDTAREYGKYPIKRKFSDEELLSEDSN